MLEDLPGSRNGTTLNFLPLPRGGRSELHHGDLIGVGRSLRLFREGGRPAPAHPFPTPSACMGWNPSSQEEAHPMKNDHQARPFAHAPVPAPSISSGTAPPARARHTVRTGIGLWLAAALAAIPLAAPPVNATGCDWKIVSDENTTWTHVEAGHPLGVLQSSVVQERDPGWGELDAGQPIWDSPGGVQLSGDFSTLFLPPPFFGCTQLFLPYTGSITILGDDNYEVFHNGVLLGFCYWAPLFNLVPAEPCWAPGHEHFFTFPVTEANTIEILARNTDGPAMIEFVIEY